MSDDTHPLPVADDRVTLGMPEVDEVAGVSRDAMASWDRDYLLESLSGDEVLYRSILLDGSLVGEIFLHDIGAERPASALVGFAIFEPELRSHGIGTRALSLMVRLVERETDLTELVVITAGTNEAAIRSDAERIPTCRAATRGSTCRLPYLDEVMNLRFRRGLR